MPLTAFWVVSRNIDKLMAEEDLRALRVSTAVMSADGVKQLRESLSRQLGMDETGSDDELDAIGLAGLKSLGRGVF